MAESSDRLGAIDDETKQLASTLHDLIQSLPRRPGSSPSEATGSPAEGISGVATPTFDDQPTDERRARSGGDGLAGDPIPPGADRATPPAEGRRESDTTARPDLGGADRRDEVVAMPSAGPVPGNPGVDPTGHPAPDRSRDPIEGSVMGRVPSGEGDPSEGRAGQGSHSFVVESAATGIVAGAVSAAIEPQAALGPGGFRPDRATNETAILGDAGTGASLETIAVGPIGPAGRPEEGLDRAASPSSTSMAWGMSPGGDPSEGGLGAGPLAVEGPGGVDMAPTNALLGQILDELRRQQQAPIASGRSVYPER